MCLTLQESKLSSACYAENLYVCVTEHWDAEVQGRKLTDVGVGSRGARPAQEFRTMFLGFDEFLEQMLHLMA